jgi:hypothetical protein
MKKKLTEYQEALQLLGECLDTALEWSGTDNVHRLAPMLRDILGEYLPSWLEESASRLPPHAG